MNYKYSYSEISTYNDCPLAWYLKYKLKYRDLEDSKHLAFGSMAHNVLEKLEIPDEFSYTDIKDSFNITSWENYFTPIFKELEVFYADKEILDTEIYLESELFKGKIDVIAKDSNGLYWIIDYKFTKNSKSIDDIDYDAQLEPIYLDLVYTKYPDVDINDIMLCYISISKEEVNKPKINKGDILSRNTKQRTTYSLYLEEILKRGENPDDYKEELEIFQNKNVINISFRPVMKSLLDSKLDNLITIMEKIEKAHKQDKHSKCMTSFRQNNCVCKNFDNFGNKM